MSIQFPTDLGITITLPEGAAAREESTAGPGTVQFALMNGEVVSLVRDEAPAGSLPEVIAWCQGMGRHFLDEYSAVEDMQGTVEAPDVIAYAYSVRYKDSEDVPRRATLIGTLFPSGVFAGITWITIDAGQELSAGAVQELVAGLSLP